MQVFSNISPQIYAGTQRVSSKIGTTENVGDYLYDWFTQGTGGPVDVIGSSFGVLENAEDGVVQVYTELGIDPPTYESTPVFIPVQSFVHGGNEVEQYYFHPDHLGSTSYITNLLGEVSQHMEYFAFGETFVEEHRSSNNSPYKFNGKELDEETGWYYYGARYYDPRISVWLSVDPLTEQTMTPYQYTYQNPVRYIDPTGMAAEDNDDIRFRDKNGNLIATYETTLIDDYVYLPVELPSIKNFKPNINLNKYLNKLNDELPDIDVIGIGVNWDFTFAMGGGYSFEAIYFLDGEDKGKYQFYENHRQNVGWGGDAGIYAIAADFIGNKENDKGLTTNDYAGRSFSIKTGLKGLGVSEFWSPIDTKSKLGLDSYFNNSKRSWTGYTIDVIGFGGSVNYSKGQVNKWEERRYFNRNKK